MWKRTVKDLYCGIFTQFRHASIFGLGFGFVVEDLAGASLLAGLVLGEGDGISVGDGVGLLLGSKLDLRCLEVPCTLNTKSLSHVILRDFSHPSHFQSMC